MCTLDIIDQERIGSSENVNEPIKGLAHESGVIIYHTFFVHTHL